MTLGQDLFRGSCASVSHKIADNLLAEAVDESPLFVPRCESGDLLAMLVLGPSHRLSGSITDATTSDERPEPD